jgi:hypothetical protein
MSLTAPEQVPWAAIQSVRTVSPVAGALESAGPAAIAR